MNDFILFIFRESRRLAMTNNKFMDIKTQEMNLLIEPLLLTWLSMWVTNKATLN